MDQEEFLNDLVALAVKHGLRVAVVAALKGGDLWSGSASASPEDEAQAGVIEKAVTKAIADCREECIAARKAKRRERIERN